VRAKRETLIFLPDNGRGDTTVTVGRDGYQEGPIRITSVVKVNGKAVLDLTDAIRPDELSTVLSQKSDSFVYQGKAYGDFCDDPDPVTKRYRHTLRGTVVPSEQSTGMAEH